MKCSHVPAAFSRAGLDPIPTQVPRFQFSMACSPVIYWGGTQKICH